MKTPDFEQFMAKIKAMEKGEKLDLSSDEDLSIVIMNLISIEEHLFFSYSKTGDEKYLDLLEKVREMRKKALKRVIKEYKGEVWCISKHLLAASMRMMEVGTKALSKKDKKTAKEMFNNAYQLYSLFWGLNLGLVKVEDLKRDDNELNLIDEGKKPKPQKKLDLFTQLNDLIKKLVNCCRE